jgi:hypothetical protein
MTFRAERRKSPLTPPFDDAQDMLFQRGELVVIALSFFDHPSLKKGERGGFSFFTGSQE